MVNPYSAYAVMGLVSLLVYKLIQIHDRAGTSYLMFYSVAIFVLAVIYYKSLMSTLFLRRARSKRPIQMQSLASRRETYVC